MEKFEKINLSQNDSFSRLRGLDLKELLVQVENTNLSYRDTLNIPPEVTFGVEIEYENASKLLTDLYTRFYLNNWFSKTDESVASGGEMASPILHDDKNSWQQLQKICHFLKVERVNTCENAGGHIHVGAFILGDDISAWQHFLYTWMTYEHILFRFFYGDKLNGRKRMDTYASPIAEKLSTYLKDINNSSTVFCLLMNCRRKRNEAVNFLNVDYNNIYNQKNKNTIEFRCPNATAEEVVWQNNINTCTKLLLAVKKKTFDIGTFQIKEPPNKIFYREICLKDALEFVDLIFDNNLDKLYFLRQYLKNFETYRGDKVTVLSKKFWK